MSVSSLPHGVEFLCDLDYGGALVEVDRHDRTGDTTVVSASCDPGPQKRCAPDLRVHFGAGRERRDPVVEQQHRAVSITPVASTAELTRAHRPKRGVLNER